MSKFEDSDKAEKVLNNLAKKYGHDYYNSEMRKNSDLYDTLRSKQKLKEFAIYEYGYKKARENRPDLDEVIKSTDLYWQAYKNECRNISDKLFDKYGDTKLYKSKYYSLSVKDTVGDVVSSMEGRNWKLKN